MPASTDDPRSEDVAAAELRAIADELGRAWEHAQAIPAPTSLRPDMTLDEAYAIQELVIESRLVGSRRRAGWKLGLTSSPGSEPIVGTLLDDMIVCSGSRLRTSEMVAPLVEAEIAFVAGEQITAAASPADLASGPHSIAAALEVIDYRTHGATGKVDWVADNSTVAWAVVGDRVFLDRAAPLSDMAVELFERDDPLARGTGSMVMGDPLAAIHWLCAHLEQAGRALEEGDVVLTGSLTGHHPVAAGSDFRAVFDRLGTVEVGFVP